MKSPFEAEISKFLNVGNDFKVFKMPCKPNCTYQRPRCPPEATGLRLVYNTMLFPSGLERNVETESTLHMRKQRLVRGFHQESMGKLCPEPVPGSLLPVILPHGWSEAEGDPRRGKGEKAHFRRLGAPPRVDLSRQPGTALSCRMLRVILQKRPTGKRTCPPWGKERGPAGTRPL